MIDGIFNTVTGGSGKATVTALQGALSAQGHDTLAAALGQWATGEAASLTEGGLSPDDLDRFAEWLQGQQAPGGDKDDGDAGSEEGKRVGLNGVEIFAIIAGVLMALVIAIAAVLRVRRPDRAHGVPMEALPDWMSGNIMMQRRTTMQNRMSTANPPFSDPDAEEVKQALLHRVSVVEPPAVEGDEADMPMLLEGAPGVSKP